MLNQELHRRILFYLIFSLFIVWIIIEPNILLSYRDGALIVLFLFLAQSLIDKRYLLGKLSEKFINQKVLLNNLFTNCPDLIYIKDEHLNYIDCNPFMKELINITPDTDVSGKNDYDLFPVETADILRSYDKKVIDNGQVVSYKFEKKLFTGEVKIYDTLVAPTLQNGKISGVLGIMRDITQNEMLKEKIMIRNAQLDSIVDNLPFIMYLKDLDGKIVVANKKVTDFVRVPLDSVVGLNPIYAYSKEFADKIKKEDAQVIHTKSTVVSEYKSNKEGLAQGWFQSFKSPILNNNGDVIGIAVLVKNIDDEKKLQVQKETFVATLTHDLKTPTTAQMQAMKILLSGSMGELNDEQKELVQLALNSNEYMINMLSTIMATYKLESGESELICEEFNFVELVDISCQEISNMAAAKNQNVTVKSDILNPAIFADKLQIKRAVINLVANAITYGFDNTVVDISLGENESYVFIDIKNQSRYIPPERLKEIFEKYKSKDSEKFNKTSTGLGLYLSKRIIDAHGGEIYAQSTQDGVCVFGFKLPKINSEITNKTQVI